MRSTVRRLVAALGILTCATTLSVLGTSSAAHAGTCYIVQVGPQSVTVCP